MIRARLPAALLVALAVAVYAPTLGHPFLLDDAYHIYKNPAVTDGAPLARFLFDRSTTSSHADYNRWEYRPLRNYAFRLIARCCGIVPIAYGLANLFVYALSTLLVLALLRRLVADERAAAWATALWVVLPVHVEPVTYYSGLGDVLSLAFELGAVVVALPLATNGKPWRYAASTLLAAASMLTKEMAVTEPAMLLCAMMALGELGWRSRRLRGLVAVHTIVAVGYVALRTHVVGRVAQEPITAAFVRDGLRDAPWLLAHYLWISVAPFGHSMAYHVPSPTTPQLVVTVAAMAAVLVVSWRWRRTVAIGLFWFIGSLALVVHLVPMHAEMADRFALVPTVGLALALAAAIAPVSRHVIVLVATLVIVYAAASLLEERAWRSESLLWRYAVDRQPDAPLARQNLATVLMEEGRIDEAAPQVEALHALGWTRIDLEIKRAYVLWRVGRTADAERAIVTALRLDPSSGLAHAIAGQLALAGGDGDGAARELAEARRLSPLHSSTGLLGYLLLRARGEVPAEDARVDYLRALQALYFDDSSAAVRAARDCLSRSPGRVQCEAALGQALALQGPLDDEARTLLDRCIAAGGPDARACQEAKWAAP